MDGLSFNYIASVSEADKVEFEKLLFTVSTMEQIIDREIAMINLNFTEHRYCKIINMLKDLDEKKEPLRYLKGRKWIALRPLLKKYGYR